MGRLSVLEGEVFDVAVIGGGIVGCGIARDAALRGLRVVVVEKRDFGSGTTSASTRIVHGGLRYLARLDVRLVRLDLRERETLLRIAPHLVKPLEFFIPFFKGDGSSALKVRTGLALYDALSFGTQLPSRRWLEPAEARQADPVLARPDLRGASAYHDARIDSPERLAIENVTDAEANHAIALNYCEAMTTIVQHGRLAGVRLRDVLDGAEQDVACRTVINATGAWFDRATEQLTSRPSHALRTTKGIHIVCPPLTRRALVLFSSVDRRLMFAIPRAGLTWIGTTDTDFAEDPASVRATRDDVEYVVDSVRHVFPSLHARDVLYTTAGVRALVRHGGSASSVSRMHRVVDGEPLAPTGMISVLGGKITGYRAIAEEVTDAICRRIGATDRRCSTADHPLPGARNGGSGAGGGTGDAALISHLEALYGSRAEHVRALATSSDGLDRRLSPKYPDIAGQVIYGVRHEHCRRLSDFMRRRTLLGASPDQGWDAAGSVAALMGSALGWSVERGREELEGYREDIARTEGFKR